MILNEFVAITGYNRCYASYVLRNLGRKVLIRVKGETVAVIVGQPRQKKVSKERGFMMKRFYTY